MVEPSIESLQQKEWQKLKFTPEVRLAALQKLEDELAEQEGRDSCPIILIPKPNLMEALNGRANPRDDALGYYKNGHIHIQEWLTESDDPYEAVETLFHEERHAYQDHVIKNDRTLEDEETVKTWEKNSGHGVISSYEDRALYYFQPREIDAREVARQHMNKLYIGHFHDTKNYSRYRQNSDNKEEKMIKGFIKAQQRVHMQIQAIRGNPITYKVTYEDMKRLSLNEIDLRNPSPSGQQSTFLQAFTREKEAQKGDLIKHNAKLALYSRAAAQTQPNQDEPNEPSRDRGREHE